MPLDSSPPKKIVAGVIACILMALFLAILFFNFRLTTAQKSQTDLAGAISEIQFLDEVLTSSAKLYTLSSDTQHRVRYDASLQPLDLAIAKAKSLFVAPEANATILSVSDANTKLVAMEVQAIDLTQNGRGSDGYLLLTSKDYLQNKSIYQEGLEKAFDILKQTAIQNVQQYQIAFWTFMTFSILGTIIFFSFLASSSRAEKASAEKIVLLRNIVDVVGNAMNNLVLISVKIRKKKPLTDQDADMIDDVLQTSSQKLRQIADFEVSKDQA